MTRFDYLTWGPFLTNSLNYSPAWRVNTFSACQEIPLILPNLRLHHRVHDSSPPVPILSHINPIHALPILFPKRFIQILSSHLRLGLSSGLFTPGFPTDNLYASFISPIRTACAAFHFFYLVTRMILAEEYRLLSSSLRKFFSPLLHHPS
jgi:hypothetical protein